MQRDRCVVQFNLRVTLGFRLDEYLSSPPINHTVLTSGRVINTALDWCEIKNAIVLSIRVVVVLLVLEGTEAHPAKIPRRRSRRRVRVLHTAVRGIPARQP